jgi:hypothetical protein
MACVGERLQVLMLVRVDMRLKVVTTGEGRLYQRIEIFHTFTFL